MNKEEVLDEVNVIYERISNYERYKDKNNLFNGRNYTEALEVLIDYYEVGFIEELEKIKAEIKANRDEWIKGQDAEWHTYDRCLYIIDNRISELKGE